MNDRAAQKTLYDQQDAVIRIIDSGAWNHSWHLPKNRNGYIDWFSIETRNEIIKILREKRQQAQAMIDLIDSIEIPPKSYYE